MAISAIAWGTIFDFGFDWLLRGSIKLGSNPHSLVESLDTLAGLGFSVFERS
ncbi:hypothetical protein L8106_11972 [Lyngbya sp. PCC 8106]|nr:hypothetical protein L8106_11972 [Lyngbya sp. PCC 8106]